MQARFIDTGSAAGGDGTTFATSGAHRAYSSMAEAGTALGVGSLADSYGFFCAGTAADTTSCNQAHLAFITTPLNFVQFTGENRSATYDATKYRIEVTNQDGIYNNFPSHVRLDAIQVQITVSSSVGDDYSGIRLATANNTTTCDHRVSNCVVKIVVSGGATDNAFGFIDSDTTHGGTCKRWNCIAFGGYCGFSSDGTSWATSNLSNFNCLGYGNEFNYIDVQICKNCISANPTTGAGFGFLSTGSSGHSNNASDDNTAAGTAARINQTFSFVNAAAGDFRLTIADTGAKGFGLTDPGSGLFSDDIYGTVRTAPWEIGPYEFPPTPSQPPPRTFPRSILMQ